MSTAEAELEQDIREARLSVVVSALRGLIEISRNVDPEVTRAIVAAHFVAVQVSRLDA